VHSLEVVIYIRLSTCVTRHKFEASKRDICVSMPNTIMLTLLKTDIVSSCVRAKLTSVKYRVSRCAIGISNNEVCHYMSQAVKTVVI
jgi:hypothetical protein